LEKVKLKELKNKFCASYYKGDAMVKILRILRSIITSFLFIFVVGLSIISIFITFFRKNEIPLSKNIDKEEILNSTIFIYSEEEKDIYINYIDESIKYIFHERSYPTIDYQKYKNLNNNKIIYENLEIIKNKLALNYNKVTLLRKICDFVENNSVLLMIFGIIFFITLLICILYFKFSAGLNFVSLALIVSSIISYLLAFYFKYLINNDIWFLTYKSAFFGKNENYIFVIVCCYFIIGLIPFVVKYFYKHFASKNKLAFFR